MSSFNHCSSYALEITSQFSVLDGKVYCNKQSFKRLLIFFLVGWVLVHEPNEYHLDLTYLFLLGVNQLFNITPQKEYPRLDFV